MLGNRPLSGKQRLHYKRQLTKLKRKILLFIYIQINKKENMRKWVEKRNNIFQRKKEESRIIYVSNEKIH